MRLGNGAKLYCGSLIPHDTLDQLDVDRDIQNVSVEEDDLYREVGLCMEDCDLFLRFHGRANRSSLSRYLKSGSPLVPCC